MSRKLKCGPWHFVSWFEIRAVIELVPEKWSIACPFVSCQRPCIYFWVDVMLRWVISIRSGTPDENIWWGHCRCCGERDVLIRSRWRKQKGPHQHPPLKLIWQSVGTPFWIQPRIPFEPPDYSKSWHRKNQMSHTSRIKSTRLKLWATDFNIWIQRWISDLCRKNKRINPTPITSWRLPEWTKWLDYEQTC